MKNTTILMAAVLAVATVLAAGLAVLPNSVQEAQANPCASSNVNENEGGGGTTIVVVVPAEDNRECEFIGNIDIDED